MIPEKSIRNEEVQGITWRFERWLKEVRLTGEERGEVETIIRELKNLIDY